MQFAIHEFLSQDPAANTYKNTIFLTKTQSQYKWKILFLIKMADYPDI